MGGDRTARPTGIGSSNRGLDFGLTVDVLNALDNQQVATVDQYGDVAPGVLSPDFNKPSSYFPPRAVRLGAKVLF